MWRLCHARCEQGQEPKTRHQDTSGVWKALANLGLEIAEISDVTLSLQLDTQNLRNGDDKFLLMQSLNISLLIQILIPSAG